MWQGNCNALQSWAVLSKHTRLSTIGTETAGAGAASLPNFYLAEYFTCVSFISHPHVNQHRQADPQNVYVLRFPAFAHRTGQPFCCRTSTDDLCGKKTFPLWLARLWKRYVKDVRCLVQATFQESIFLPPYWKSNKYLGDRAFSWLQSLPATELDN